MFDLNQLILQFAEWVAALPISSELHESFYMYNWIETTHVLTLMLSLGMLFVIDARMAGWWLTEVPASKLAARLATPMWIGFAIMIITGILLYIAIPVRTSQSIWFRIKLILLVAAAINAWTFHRHLNASAGAWDSDQRPPRRTRVAAMVSLSLWAGVIVCGRFIAYDWFDCDREMPALMQTLTGCSATPTAVDDE